MRPLTLRDIIGPIMVGPSSSHTAGALHVAAMVRSLLDGEPRHVRFTLYGSFARTGSGHGTDKALVAGILGLHSDDTRIRQSFELAQEAGVAIEFENDYDTDAGHPNTVDIWAESGRGSAVEARGVSIGGGAAKLTRINGIDVDVTGEFNSMIVHQVDVPGILSHISGCLAGHGINIATMTLHRTAKRADAFTVLQIDDPVCPEVADEILSHPSIKSVRLIPADSLGRSFASEPTFDRAAAEDRFQEVDFARAAELLAYCTQHGLALSEGFMARERAWLATQGADAEVAERYLRRVLEVMRASTVPDSEEKPLGGLIGGESEKLRALAEAHAGVCDEQTALLSANAMGVLETNASMGRIVRPPRRGRLACSPPCCSRCRRRRGTRMTSCAARSRARRRSATLSRATPRWRAQKVAARRKSAPRAPWQRQRPSSLPGERRVCAWMPRQTPSRTCSGSCATPSRASCRCPARSEMLLRPQMR
ncbi:MAG: L-serine ammonia-lyase, iron-sulfur-dependent subunit beta [Coriobacteriaceae bacterium]|nr:L-serine ammonia-lyase, iron-sulfur-dependent subunit beta [Coriobacteriaceae bacterium]